MPGGGRNWITIGMGNKYSYGWIDDGSIVMKDQMESGKKKQGEGRNMWQDS